MSDCHIWPSTLPPCPVASDIICRVVEAGPDCVEMMFAMGKAPCDICGHVNDIPRHYGDWQCSQCQQGYEYEEGHAIKLTDAQWKLLRDCRWIPVSEQLPDDCSEILVIVGEDCDDCGLHVCSYRGGKFCRFEAGYVWGVTHWMPLPEPPSA